MRGLVAIALVVASAANAQAQRVAPIGAIAHGPSAAFAVALLSTTPRHSALPAASPSAVIVDDGLPGGVWTWVVLGTLVGGVVGGVALQTHCSRDPGSCAEFSIPLGTVLGGIGGAVLGAFAFEVTHRERH